ncbi:hypothetical protein ACQZV8_07690 [Magnetococcales bacterium HHB-1]
MDISAISSVAIQGQRFSNQAESGQKSVELPSHRQLKQTIEKAGESFEQNVRTSMAAPRSDMAARVDLYA